MTSNIPEQNISGLSKTDKPLPISRRLSNKYNITDYVDLDPENEISIFPDHHVLCVYYKQCYIWHQQHVHPPPLPVLW